MSRFQVLAKLTAKQNLLVFIFSTITLDSISLRLHFHSNGTGCIDPDRDTAQELGTHGQPRGARACAAPLAQRGFWACAGQHKPLGCRITPASLLRTAEPAGSSHLAPAITPPARPCFYLEG